MADRLVRTGDKDVRKHTGTEMVLVKPKRGGDTHMLKQWWRIGGSSTCYVDCTVFNVTTAAGTVKLALDTNMGTNIRIDHDGSFNFNFYGINEVRRAALFIDDYQLIEHYLFPAISRGKIVTATTPGAAVRPTPPSTPTTSTSTPDPTPDPTPEPTPTPAPSSGPTAIDGYYPLYTSEADANAAGDGSSHTHEFSGITYYMPNGVTFYHGDYGSGSGY